MDYNQAIKEHEPLIHEILKRYYPPNNMYDDEDLIQIGRIALWKCLKAYDPSTGNKFSTLAHLSIRRELNKMLNRERMQKRDFKTVSYNVRFDDWDEWSVFFPAKDNVEESVIANEYIEKSIEIEPKIASMRAQGYSFREIGKEINLTSSRVQQRMSEVKKRVLS